MNKPDLSEFRYDPDTGLIYRERTMYKQFNGPCLSTDFYGYKKVNINGVTYKQHRLAFQLMGIDIPDEKEVDHINGLKHDNRWCNLRLVTRTENHRNLKRHRQGKTPYVHYGKKQGWRVQRYCALTKKNVFHGYFKTEQEAISYVKENFNI